MRYRITCVTTEIFEVDAPNEDRAFVFHEDGLSEELSLHLTQSIEELPCTEPLH